MAAIKASDPVGAAVLETGVKMLVKNGSLKIPGVVPGQEVKINAEKKKRRDNSRR